MVVAHARQAEEPTVGNPTASVGADASHSIPMTRSSRRDVAADERMGDIADAPAEVAPPSMAGPTRGRPWSSAAARSEMRHAAAGVRRRFDAAPASPRACRRDGARRRFPDRHPAATRPQQPRRLVGLPPRQRQRRDHRHRPRAPCANGPCRHHTVSRRGAATRRAKRVAIHLHVPRLGMRNWNPRAVCSRRGWRGSKAGLAGGRLVPRDRSARALDFVRRRRGRRGTSEQRRAGHRLLDRQPGVRARERSSRPQLARRGQCRMAPSRTWAAS